MIYRAAILSTILLASTISAKAAAPDAYTFKGTCSSGALTSHPLNYGTISESDGVQARPSGGMMSTEGYFALMKRAKAAHLTLGSDDFLWATRPVQCDSAIVWVRANSKGDTLVSFSNGDLSKPVLGFKGALLQDDQGTTNTLVADSVYLGEGKPLPVNPGIQGPICRIYSARVQYKVKIPPTDPITYKQLVAKAEAEAEAKARDSWADRITVIECNAKMKRADGHLISADVRFDATLTPGAATANQAPSGSAR